MSHQQWNPSIPRIPHPAPHTSISPHTIPPGIPHPRENVAMNRFLSQPRNLLTSQIPPHGMQRPGFNQPRGRSTINNAPVIGGQMPGTRPWLPNVPRPHNTTLPHPGFNPTLPMNPTLPGHIYQKSLGNNVPLQSPGRPELSRMPNLSASRPLHNNSLTHNSHRNPVSHAAALSRAHNVAPLGQGFNHTLGATIKQAHDRYFPTSMGPSQTGATKDNSLLARFHNTTLPRPDSSRIPNNGNLFHSDSTNPLYGNRSHVVSSQVPNNKLPRAPPSVHSNPNVPYHGDTTSVVTWTPPSNKLHDTRPTTYTPHLQTRHIGGSIRPGFNAPSHNNTSHVIASQTDKSSFTTHSVSLHTQPHHISKPQESNIPLHGKPSHIITTQRPPDKLYVTTTRPHPNLVSSPSPLHTGKIPPRGITSQVTSTSNKSHESTPRYLDSSHTTTRVETLHSKHGTSSEPITSGKISSEVQIDRSVHRNSKQASSAPVSSSNTTLSLVPFDKKHTTTSHGLRCSPNDNNNIARDSRTSTSVTSVKTETDTSAVGKAIPTISHVRPENVRVTDKTKDLAGDQAPHSGAHNNLVLTGNQRRSTTSVPYHANTGLITSPAPIVLLPRGAYNLTTYSPFSGSNLNNAGYSAFDDIRKTQLRMPLNPMTQTRLYPNVVDPHLLSYPPIAPVAPLPRDTMGTRLPRRDNDDQGSIRDRDERSTKYSTSDRYGKHPGIVSYVDSSSQIERRSDRRLSPDDRRASLNDDVMYLDDELYKERGERRGTPDIDSRSSRRVREDSRSRRKVYTPEREDLVSSHRKRRHSSGERSVERHRSRESPGHSRRRGDELPSFEDHWSDGEVDLIDFVASFESGKKRRTEADRRKREDRSMERGLAGSREETRKSSRHGNKERTTSNDDDHYNEQHLPFFGGIELSLVSEESDEYASPRHRSSAADFAADRKDYRRRDRRSLSPFKDAGQEKSSGFRRNEKGNRHATERDKIRHDRQETKKNNSEKERTARHDSSEIKKVDARTSTQHETRRRDKADISIHSTKGDTKCPPRNEGSRREDKNTKTRHRDQRSSKEKQTQRKTTTESVQNKDRLGSSSQVENERPSRTKADRKARGRSDPEYKSRSSSCYCLPEPNVRRTMVYEKSQKYYNTPKSSTTKSTSVGTSELEKIHRDFEENVGKEQNRVPLSDSDDVFEVIDDIEDECVTEMLDDNQDEGSDEDAINLDGYTIVDDDDDDDDVIDKDDDEEPDDDDDDVIDNEEPNNDDIDDDDDKDDDNNGDVMDNNDGEGNDDDNIDHDNDDDVDDDNDYVTDDNIDHDDQDNDHNDSDIIDDSVDDDGDDMDIDDDSFDDIDIDDKDDQASRDDIDPIDYIESRNEPRSNGLHPELWYNIKGQVNQGKECKCKAGNKSKWIIHDVYPSEEKPEPCQPLGNNSLKLYHYWVTISPQSNFMTERPTRIEFSGETYTFEGFSLLTHTVLDSVPPCFLTRFNIKYQLFFIQEPIPDNFCIKDLDLFTKYLFHDILELYDWTMYGKDATEGCNLFHFLPRFTRVIGVTNGGHEEHELLSMSEVLKYLIRSYQPLLQDVDLKDKETWKRFSDSCMNMLVTNACSKPKTLRIDEIKHSKGKPHPVILHHGIRPVQLSFAGNLKCQKLLKAYMKLRTSITNRPNASDGERLKLLKMKLTLDNMRMKDSLRRDCCVEVSAVGMRKTGLHSDVTQHAMLLPVLIHHIRFHLSLRSFDAKFGYAFKDRTLLQLALTHPSYVLNYGTNADHARNTLSNCGVKKPRYGDKRNNLKYSKKKGIVHLINIMAKLEDLDGSQSFIHHNERLEFLGDAVLEFICTAHLFFLFPEMSEGSMVKHRSSLVRNKHLATIAKKLELDSFMRFSHGPDLCHEEDMDHALANCFEALLGAIYLDSGLHTVRRVFCEHAFDEIELRELWCNLQPHPLQDQLPQGDRSFIHCSEVLKKLVKLEESIGFQFDHIRLLARAFTHPSVRFNNLTIGNNQRMEFLGDAIIQLITTDYLYRHFPDHHEGHLTLLRSSLVNNQTQAQIAAEIGLNLYVNFGIGQMIPKLRQKHLADLFEAFLAAMFIDKGLEPVELFCKVCLFPRLKAVIMKQEWLDAKSRLQACCVTQTKQPDKLPIYKVLRDHGSAEMKHFTVGVYFNGKRLGTGQGESIREAEMKAAQHALKSNYFPELARQKKVLHAKHKHIKMEQAR